VYETPPWQTVNRPDRIDIWTLLALEKLSIATNARMNGTKMSTD
jgi:hypothetical protein